MAEQPAALQPAEFLRRLRADWGELPGGRELETAVGAIAPERKTETAWALEAIRAATLALARCVEPALRPLFGRALQYYVGRPLREWDEVLWILDVAAVRPAEARALVRTLIVSVRLGVKGDVPWLADLGEWGDATHELLPAIAGKLGVLFVKRRELGEALYRQTLKTLPHMGAAVTEIEDVRAAPEGLQWLLECPLTQDIREEIHSHASPANLTLVRAYLLYLEKGDASGLDRLWLTQKIPEHDRKLRASADPEALKQKLIGFTRELEANLKRIYAFDPESPDSVLADIALWLKTAGAAAPREAAALLEQCRRGDSRSAAVTLVSAREALAGTVAAAEPVTGLRLLYLDLELEKLGYLLFGDLVNTRISTLTVDSLPDVIAILRAMIASESLKGWDSPRLAWLGRALREVPADTKSRLARMMVLNHQINDEIARIGLMQYQGYSDIARRIFEACRAPDARVEATRFVDGLIRGTTLQHIGELALRLYHFVVGSLENMGEEVAAEVRARVEQYHGKFESEAARVAAEAGKGEPATPMWIFRFQPGKAAARPDLSSASRDPSASVLGGKGAALCIMSALGLPVPPGFVVSVGACERYMSIHALDPSVHREIHESMAWLETLTGRTFGGTPNPLLVSVRSGAPVSMPGMLDTILNVGMTDAIARALAELLSDEAAALDSYLHFLLGYARSVLALEGLPRHLQAQPTWDTVERVKRRILDAGMEPFWEDTREQVIAAVGAVFRSWDNPHAVLFRKTKNMPQMGCTAATVQQMVFGNADARSCTGVVFTRHPMTGAHELYGEYLPRAHGEDLVSGLWTPLPIQPSEAHPGKSLMETMPDIVGELRRVGHVLEERFGDTQDIEFTVERGTLYLLQTRPVPRSASGGDRIQTEQPAPLRSGRGEPESGPAARYRIVARGIGASPGGAVGRIALTADAVRRFAEAGAAVIFVRATTTPEDLAGMVAAAGVLTQRGGVTSHAANNARYMGKPCVVGCVSLVIDERAGTVAFGGRPLHEGDTLFIDGMSGEVGLPATP